MYTFVICEDINIDLVKYDKDTEVNNYVSDITSMGCVISIDRSTRMTETSSTILDHFWSSHSLISQRIQSLDSHS